jgi:hypothetical protein
MIRVPRIVGFPPQISGSTTIGGSWLSTINRYTGSRLNEVWENAQARFGRGKRAEEGPSKAIQHEFARVVRRLDDDARVDLLRTGSNSEGT